MKTLVIKLFFLFIATLCLGVNIPGCGDLEDIRWNSSCLQSSVHHKNSTLHHVLTINNLLIYDGKFYVIVPPKKNETTMVLFRYKLERFANQEVQFEVVNVSSSPLTFGQARHDNQYDIKEILEFKNAIIMQSRNLKTKTLQQVNYEGIDYASSEEIYSILCHLLSICTIDDSMRNNTLLISILNSQMQLDWDNGVNLLCFSRLGQFPLVSSIEYNSTLFILRQAVMYLPNPGVGHHHNNHNHHDHHNNDNNNHHNNRNNNHNPNNHNNNNNNPNNHNNNLRQSVQEQCIEAGFAYDALNRIKDQKKYEVAICSVFRNEGKYLIEWIAYHITIGVQHFYLYNDKSTDNSLEILAPLIKQSLVTIIHTKDVKMFDFYGWQGKPLKHCGDNFGQQSQWLLVVDVDEFVVIKGSQYNNNLSTWISVHQDILQSTGSVVIPLNSLAGNYYPINRTQLVIAEIIYKRYTSHRAGKGFKSLTNTNGMLWMTTHFAYTYLPLRNGKLNDSCRLRDSHNSNCVATDSIEVFHYIVKSYEQCANKTKPSLWKRTDWRKEKGLRFCDDMVFGKNFEPKIWHEERFLANDSVIKKVCQTMKQLNERWYTTQNACTNYQAVVDQQLTSI